MLPVAPCRVSGHPLALTVGSARLMMDGDSFRTLGHAEPDASPHRSARSPPRRSALLANVSPYHPRGWNGSVPRCAVGSAVRMWGSGAGGLPMSDIPSGTVTFLFTDIEGSTALWERDPVAMASAVARHLTLLRGAIEAHTGVLFKTVGDGTQAAFAS